MAGTTPDLPPVLPNGGGGQLTTADLPTFGGVAQGAALAANDAPVTDPMIRAQLAQKMLNQTASAVTGLPSFNLTDPSLVGRVAVPARVGGSGQDEINVVNPNASPMMQWAGQSSAQHHFDNRLSRLANSGPGFGERFLNWTGLRPDNTLNSRQQAADFYSHPDARTYMSQHPGAVAEAEADPVGFAMKLGPILDAHVQAINGAMAADKILHPDGMMKDNTNPALTKAVADAHGTPEGTAHAMIEPHQYSWPEFVKATKGMTNRQAQQMWEMQHYLNPAQQATSTLLSSLTNQVNAARKTNDVTTANAAQERLNKLLWMMTTGMPQQ